MSQVAFPVAVAREPRFKPGYLALARLSIAEGKPEEALKAYDRVLGVDPKDAEARAAKIAVLIQKKAYEPAIVQARENMSVQVNHRGHFSQKLMLMVYRHLNQKGKLLQQPLGNSMEAQLRHNP